MTPDLFGAGFTDSDVDVLVVMPEGVHRRKTARHLYREIRGLGVPFDISVTPPESLEKHKDNIGLICYTNGSGCPVRQTPGFLLRRSGVVASIPAMRFCFVTSKSSS